MILDKYLRNEKNKKSGTEGVTESLASDASLEESAKALQRRLAASEVKCKALTKGISVLTHGSTLQVFINVFF